MIRLKKDMETIKVENTGNIAGVIHKEIILTPAEMLDKAYAEIYYILEGEVSVTDNGQEAILHSGDVVFTGNGDTHSIKNIGTTDATFLAVILK